MSREKTIFVDLLLPVAVPNLYTYHLPDSLDSSNVIPGVRVCVQFGNRKLFTALVIRVHETPPEHYKTKEVLTILDDKPVVKSWQPEFWRWISDYYMCTMGEVFNAALPAGLKPEGQTRIYLCELPETGVELTPSEENIVHIIENELGITIDKLKNSQGNKNVINTLRNLVDKGVASFDEELLEKYKTKTVDFVCLHPNLQNESSLNELLNHLERRAPKQLDALLVYLQLSGNISTEGYMPVAKAHLSSHSTISPVAVKALADKNILEIIKKESTRLETGHIVTRDVSLLSEKQNLALETIKKQFKEKDVVLLHGVTSSGKTEIYIHLINDQLNNGKQVLYLLPEIALTTQIITRLRNVFGDSVGIYHSKFSDSERVEVWNNLISKGNNGNEIKIILGVRSSVFLPFDNLGLIIVDEEHENTYKQFDPAPRYHARDTSIYLASVHNAKVLLGTATPSIESYFNAKNGKYGLVELFERHLDIKLPEIQVVNIIEARRRKQMSSHFSPQLISEITQALNNQEQIILFQNRRGFSSFLECKECGWVPVCKNCDVSLTYHKGINRLVCHYCGYNSGMVQHCKACGSTNITTRGFGTEMVEGDISILFPEARIARMDLDTTRRKKAYEEIIEQFTTGQIDILIGTQMVSKGLDFDNVSVVGILNADIMLNYPDFRAHERSFQLMAQVSGRSGRKKKQGKVIIQTSDPKHNIISQVVTNNYTEFFGSQMGERSQFRYPPYFRLINIITKHKQRETAHQAANLLVSELRKELNAQILGPEAPLVGRVQNWFLESILIKLPKSIQLGDQKRKILTIIDYVKTQPGFSTIVINVDVDPY